MKKKSILSKSDKKLFRNAVKDVRVLKGEHQRFINHRIITKPSQESSENREWQDSNLSDANEDQLVNSEEKLSYSKPGIQHKILKKLSNGKLPIEAKLDLHGLNINQARNETELFIHQCQLQGYKCIIIVHGKSIINQQPILKSMLNRWLPQISSVLAFSSSLPQDGGRGAVYVLIKSKIPHNLR